ncbi:hypothetical protein TNCV_858391, partial [Trichonephila clavipes]
TRDYNRTSAYLTQPDKQTQISKRDSPFSRTRKRWTLTRITGIRTLFLFFRSELIAIDEALRIIKTMTSPDEIWILCDSRSAIQHLSDWTNVGDKTSVSLLKILKNFPSNMRFTSNGFHLTLVSLAMTQLTF